MLRGIVSSGVGAGNVSRYRTVVDDASSLWILVLHDAKGFLHAKKDAGEVDGYDLLPLVERNFFEWGPGQMDPSVVEEHV